MKYPEEKKKRSGGGSGKGATAEDVPGTGQARRAADEVEGRKSRNRDYLRMAQQAVNPKRDNSSGGD